MSRIDDLERASTWLMEHDDDDDPGPLADLIRSIRREAIAEVILALENDAYMSTEPMRSRLVLHANIFRKLT